MTLFARFRTLAARALAAGLILGLMGAGAAHAKLPAQERISSDALLAVGISDTAQFWSKARALPLTQAITQYLNSPQMTQNLQYQQFQLQQKKLEQQLGYPFTPEELLGNVFASAVALIEPGAKGDKPGIIIALEAKDKAKAEKLAAALDDFNRETAEEMAAQAQAPAGGAPQGVQYTFDQVKIGGAPVSHYHLKTADGKTQDGYYALTGGRLLYASSQAAFEKASQGKPAQEIGKNATFAKLTKSLPWSKAEVAGWMDSAGIAAIAQNPMLEMMQKMAPAQSERIAFTLQLEQDGVIGQVASTATPQNTELKPRLLKSLGYVAPAPLLSMSYGLVDARQSLRQFNGFMQTLSMAQAMQGGQQEGSPALQNPLAGIERQLGISLENDLAPALGSEVMVSLNSLRFDLMQGMVPTLDLLVGVEVKDQARMKQVMAKFEAYVEGQLGGMTAIPGAAAGAGAAKFQTQGGVRTFDTGQPSLRPSYAMTDDYLVLGLSPESVQGALARVNGRQASALSSPLFSELKTMARTDKIYSYAVVDVKQATQSILMPMASMMMLSNPGKMTVEEQQQMTALLTQVLPMIGTAASIETVQDGLAMGYFKLKMQ